MQHRRQTALPGFEVQSLARPLFELARHLSSGELANSLRSRFPWKMLSELAFSVLSETVMPGFLKISVLCPHAAAAIPLIHRYLRHVMRFTQCVALTD